MRGSIDPSTLTGWFAGRLPDDWFTATPDVRVDREEILVVGTLAEPEYPEGADDAARGAARRARIQRFREETRDQRMKVADAVHVATGVEQRAGGLDVPYSGGPMQRIRVVASLACVRVSAIGE